MISEKEILLAPNGRPSNLSPEQYSIVRTPEFKAWFGDWEKLALIKRYDSGIDDITLSEISKDVSKVVDENGEPLVVYHGTAFDFNIFKKTRFGKLGEGMYFTSFKKSAIRYAQKYSGNKIIGCFLNSKKTAIITTPFSKYELPQEYDGVWAFKGKEGEEIVVFEPNQIKIADGSNKIFDGNNPDIRFNKGGKLICDYDKNSKSCSYACKKNNRFFIEEIEYVEYLSLPHDIRLLIFQLTEDLDYVIHIPKKLPQIQIDLSKFPYVPFNNKDRGIKYAEKMVYENDLPPIIVSGKYWIDGRHRVWAAKKRGDKYINAIDIQELKIPNIEKYSMGIIDTSTEKKFNNGGIIVGEEMGEFKFPTIEEAYEIIRDSHTSSGGVWIAENEYEEMDAMFDSVIKSQEYVKEVYSILESLYDKEYIPVYRCVNADEVELDPYSIGESWSFSLEAAKEFGSHLGVKTSELKIISGYVPRQNVDWKKAFYLYHQFSDLGDSDAEFELPIPSNNKIIDVKVSS